MPFDAIFENIANSDATRNSIITDGQFTCAYSEVAAYLNEIDQFVNGLGAKHDDCFAVECINSVPGALLLLALFRRGTSFVLFPPVAVNSDLKPTPHFCRFNISVSPAKAAEPFALSPARYLHGELNPLYNGAPSIPGQLYLRTSGSMGTSKIVVHTHEKLIGNARNVVAKYRFTSASKAVIPVPIAHMYGFGAEFLPAVLTGASIDLQEKTNVLKYLDREKRFQPTIAFTTPAICDMLLKGFKTPRTTYKAFVVSGQRIGEDLFRAFDPLVSGKLINQYGSTEMGATAACDLDDTLDQRATTIGKPMADVQLRIDAAEDEAGGAAGAGHLYCRHPYGFEGYMDENGEWLHRAPEDGWYRTGDVAAVRNDGSMVVLGRADASVNRSGYLVLLSDIERVMEKLDTLGEVVVVAGRGETKRGQRIAAFCVPRPGVALDGTEVRERCFDVLPHYAIPDEVCVIETFPMLPSGKVDRQRLAAQLT